MREDGYYWVRLRLWKVRSYEKKWQIAQFRGGWWSMGPDNFTLKDDDFAEIDERAIKRSCPIPAL